MKKALAGILKEHGYVEDFSLIDDKKQGILMVYLRYSAPRKSVITGIKRISKPGRRIYVDKANIPQVLNGMGIAILSTSKGVITDRQAREAGVGGEWICSVW
jgi:small subunit ribosomal protein S8